MELVLRWQFPNFVAKFKYMNRGLLILFTAVLCIYFNSACISSKHPKAYMHKAYKTIKKSVQEAEVSSLHDTVKVLFPSNLMFGFNSASISQDIMPSMHRFANALNKFHHTNVLITGYTDSVGTDEYNNRLSSERADTAKASLVQLTVLPERIKTWGMGKRYPIASNETEEGRAKNRRVEFIILLAEKK
jgi:outer membrane protein OmpA-like peptidoglycan-associated protein